LFLSYQLFGSSLTPQISSKIHKIKKGDIILRGNRMVSDLDEKSISQFRKSLPVEFNKNQLWLI